MDQLINKKPFLVTDYEPLRREISQFLNTKITFKEVSDEILLMELGMPANNVVLANFIVKFHND